MKKSSQKGNNYGEFDYYYTLNCNYYQQINLPQRFNENLKNDEFIASADGTKFEKQKKKP